MFLLQKIKYLEEQN